MFNIFPYVFQTTFNTLMNSDFIDNIIDKIQIFLYSLL